MPETAITVGAEIPPLERTISLTDMVRYAAATWDFHRYHYDEAFARAMGMPAPFIDGQMYGAIIAAQISAWAGPESFIRRMSLRYASMAYAGERIRSTGMVTAVEERDGALLATCELNIHGVDERLICGPATVVVEIPQ